MEILTLLHNLLFDYTLRTVVLGTAALGIISGALGSFAVLRRQSLLGDAISHAALPGIVIAFLITRSKEPSVLMLGAAVAGLLATILILRIVGRTRIKYDSALGFVLSVFFGFGLMLLTYTQRLPDASQAGLDKFLFGQAATLLVRDVVSIAILGAASLFCLGLLWKEFKLLSFDAEFAASLGFPARGLDMLLTTLLVVAIVIGLQAVGVVLMSAMLIAPAVAARQWTDRLGWMVTLAAFFGALAGVIGAVTSSYVPRLSTGPASVLAISGIVLLSLLLAPNRGLVWSWIRQQHNRRQVRLDTTLLDLYALAAQHTEPGHSHTTGALQALRPYSGDARRSLRILGERGLVQANSQDAWVLTTAGVSAAKELLASGSRADEIDLTQRAVEVNA